MTMTEAEDDYINEWLNPDTFLRYELAFHVNSRECFYSHDNDTNWYDVEAILDQFGVPRSRYLRLNEADRCTAYLDNCDVTEWVSQDGVYQLLFDDGMLPVSDTVQDWLLQDGLPAMLFQGMLGLYAGGRSSSATINALTDAIRTLQLWFSSIHLAGRCIN
jgi:hypothetical protein